MCSRARRGADRELGKVHGGPLPAWGPSYATSELVEVHSTPALILMLDEASRIVGLRDATARDRNESEWLGYSVAREGDTLVSRASEQR